MLVNVLKVVLAAGGFIGGFLWSVSSWSGSFDPSAFSLLGSNSLVITMATLAYCLSVAYLFGAKKTRAGFFSGLLAPISFFGSFLVGATGMRMALWLVV